MKIARQGEAFSLVEMCEVLEVSLSGYRAWKRGGKADRYATHTQIKATAFEYIEVFYNRKRLHSTLSYQSPTQFLENWLRQQQQKKLVA
jgi:transposase InsO family protein